MNHALRFKQGQTIRFIGHPNVLLPVAVTKKLSLREWLRAVFTAKIAITDAQPFPELIQFGKNEFVGHPLTIAQAKREIAEKQRDDAVRSQHRRG